MLRFSGSIPRFSKVSKLMAAVAFSAVVLAGCSGLGTGLSGLSTTRAQGTDLSDSALQQIRPGQSADLVTTVLGSPQTRSTFGEETAFYYVETKVEETTFGLRTIKERTVLAVYFDDQMRVKDKAVYGLEDGQVIAIESRRTPSFGEDRTFIESIISSFGG